MSSVVISGDTSGSVTLTAPAVSGSTVLTLPATSGTVLTTASGQWITTGSNIYYNTGNVGIGTTSPVAPLSLYSATTTSLQVTTDGTIANIISARYSTNTGAAAITMRKGRGTLASPTAIASGDQLGQLLFQGYGGTNIRNLANILGVVDTYTSDTDISTALTFGTSPSGSTTATEQMRITSAGLLQFNSGYGSVATAYGCRAWVNFNGTGTVAIRASGNVTSITDNNTGNYTINLTTAMPDVNYSANVTVGNSGTGRFSGALNSSTTAVLILSQDSAGTALDMSQISLTVFR